jgi:protein-tyrosine phosphatase
VTVDHTFDDVLADQQSKLSPASPDPSTEGSPGAIPAPAPEFSILVVCTGNICRSPALERVLLAALGSGTGVGVSSAGLHAVVGAPIHAPMAELLVAQGIDPDGFAARQLEPEMVQDADLVIGFTRRHRSAAVTLHPPAIRHSFTLLELARAVEAVGSDEVSRHAGGEATMVQRLQALVPLALANRAYVDPDLDDIEDPYGRDPEVYERVFRRILVAADPLYRVIVG